MCGDEMSGERGDLFSEVGVSSRQGDERRLIRGGGCRKICKRGSHILLHFRHFDLVLLKLTDVGGVAGSLRGENVIPRVLKYFVEKDFEVLPRSIDGRLVPPSLAV